jgi:hypothetical protein
MDTSLAASGNVVVSASHITGFPLPSMTVALAESIVVLIITPLT